MNPIIIQFSSYLILAMLVNGCATPGGSLNKAIRTNNYDAVLYQLSSGIDINDSGDLYSTPLITAIHYQRKNIVKLLLENGANPNKADRESREPLKEAVKLKDYDTVRLLLNSGADPTQGVCDALYVAIDTIADHAMVKLLADNGGDLHKKHTYDVVKFNKARDSFVELPSRSNLSADLSSSIVIEGSILFVAISKGYYDIAKVLLESGADINELDTHGRTPLIISVLNNQKESTRLLLDYKPDLLLKNQAKNALQYAVKHKSVDIADMLEAIIRENNLSL